MSRLAPHGWERLSGRGDFDAGPLGVIAGLFWLQNRDWYSTP